MDLRDYLRLIRRGWALVVAVILVCISAAALYLVIAPTEYTAAATLLVTVNDPDNIGDAQQGLSSATSVANTYAGVIDSAAVLGPVSDSLSPTVSVSDAIAMVTATARTSSALIDVSATGHDPAVVTDLVNRAAVQATTIIPALQGRSTRNSPITLKVIQNATRPTGPVSPNSRQVLALGLIFGIVAGLAATIAAQTLTSRLRRPEDVQRAGPSVLAALPRIPRSQRQGVVVANHPSSPVVEAYRTLRTNLGDLESDVRRSLLVTPVTAERYPAEIPVNLAWSLAQAGRTVLLVDLDLRRAPISEMLQLPTEPGLADLLESPIPLEVATRGTPNPRVHVVTAGSPHASPSDVISLPRLGELIRMWERQYDYVVLNAPSLLQYTDAVVVARATGVTIITVHAERTHAEDLDTALGTLRNVRVEPLGVVLTNTAASVVRDNRRIRGGRMRSRVINRTVEPTAPEPAESREPIPGSTTAESVGSPRT